jgi:hypothetical protein
MAYDVGRSLSNFTAVSQHRRCRKSWTLVGLPTALHRVVGNSAAAIFRGSSRTVTPLVMRREKICWRTGFFTVRFAGHGCDNHDDSYRHQSKFLACDATPEYALIDTPFLKSVI